MARLAIDRDLGLHGPGTGRIDIGILIVVVRIAINLITYDLNRMLIATKLPLFILRGDD